MTFPSPCANPCSLDHCAPRRTSFPDRLPRSAEACGRCQCDGGQGKAQRGVALRNPNPSQYGECGGHRPCVLTPPNSRNLSLEVCGSGHSLCAAAT